MAFLPLDNLTYAIDLNISNMTGKGKPSVDLNIQNMYYADHALYISDSFGYYKWPAQPINRKILLDQLYMLCRPLVPIFKCLMEEIKHQPDDLSELTNQMSGLKLSHNTAQCEDMRRLYFHLVRARHNILSQPAELNQIVQYTTALQNYTSQFASHTTN